MIIAVSGKAAIHHCARIVPRCSPADFVGNIKTINVEEMIQYPQVCALNDVQFERNHQIILVRLHPAGVENIFLRDLVNLLSRKICVSLVVLRVLGEREALVHEELG